jgi:DNA-binding NarL/FixJ family response regulator
MATIRLPKTVLHKPLNPDTLRRIRNRALSLKVLVVSEHSEQHVLLLFDDIGAAYHIRTGEELDRIIDALHTIRDQAFPK